MLKMTAFVEQANRRPRSFCPLRTSLIPKHITLDTTTLVHLLWDQGAKSKLLTAGELVRNKAMIWGTFFHVNKKEFTMKKYRFNNMIDTDGVSASLLFIRSDLYGKKTPKRKAVVQPEQYIDDITGSEIDELSKRKVIGIDPNMSDLLYCANEDASEQFRYTQNQRRQETKKKKYDQIIQNAKNHEYVEERSITQWETDLTVYNHKTLSFEGFKAYVQAKLLVNSKIETSYKARIYRKLKLNRFWNTRKSEQKMLHRLAQKLKKPEEVVIGIGDSEQKKHRKFKEPTKGKGFRNLLRNGGYKVYLVDEFRTSCQCSHCQQEDAKCEKFRVRLEPKKKLAENERRLRLVHGLLACKKCNKLWNRDVNSAINTARLTRESLAGRSRPTYLSRAATPPEVDSAVASTA